MAKESNKGAGTEEAHAEANAAQQGQEAIEGCKDKTKQKGALVANSCEKCEEFRIFLVFQARLAESAP
jgi:hypothetical protein